MFFCLFFGELNKPIADTHRYCCSFSGLSKQQWSWRMYSHWKRIVCQCKSEIICINQFALLFSAAAVLALIGDCLQLRLLSLAVLYLFLSSRSCFLFFCTALLFFLLLCPSDTFFFIHSLSRVWSQICTQKKKEEHLFLPTWAIRASAVQQCNLGAKCSHH